MPRTHIRPSRDLRNHYADIVKSLKEHDHVVITNNGVGESVLISFDDYAKYEEFLHYRFIYDELQKSKREAENPDDELIDAKDVFAGIRQRIAERGL